MSRKGFVPLYAAIGLVLALMVPASASATFSYGVQASEVKPTSAMLWAHADSSGPVTAEVATSKKFSPLTVTCGDYGKCRRRQHGAGAGDRVEGQQGLLLPLQAG